MGAGLMQPLAAGPTLDAYMTRLRSSHDFDIDIDVLDLNENLIGSAAFLDGQANITAGPQPRTTPSATDLVRRTASLTLSDPDGALDFSNGSAYSGTTIWVDRLVRVRHTITVPGFGSITAIPFIGAPTGMSRQGAEVQVELSDKGYLATGGARPLTLPKGMNAATAIRRIFTFCTGEFRFRIPSHTRKLSKAYTVGLSPEASPFAVAYAIAQHEMGMQLLYSCDGYLMLRPLPSQPVADMGSVTEQASMSADFTKIANWVKVTGKASHSQPVSTVQTKPSDSVSPERLQRQGVLRLLPLVIADSAYTTTAQTAARATRELTTAAEVAKETSASVVPMFHLDADDLVTVSHTTGGTTMRLNQSSIPFGVGGDQTIGFHRWVSEVALARPKSHRVIHRRHHHRKGRHK